MSTYELFYLMAYASEQLTNLFSVFVGFSSAAIIGAYVAGKHLTRLLAWGIVGLYSVTALSFISGRVLNGQAMARLQQDLLEAAQRDNVQLHVLEGMNVAQGYGVYFGLPIWIIIAIAVVFFVFYARSRLSD